MGSYQHLKTIMGTETTISKRTEVLNSENVFSESKETKHEFIKP